MKNTIKLLLIFTFAFSFYANAQTPIVICPAAGGFTGMTRGYHFTAQTNFTICGLYVEDDLSTLFQSVAIVRFTAGAPPAFAGTTNNFVTLFQNLNYAPNNMVPVPNVAINAGDIIGIYGSRGANSVNSYSAAGGCPGVLINGIPHTLLRSGMQADLAAGPSMANIWSEVNGPIGRVTMYTNCCPTPPAVPAVNGTTTVCEGDTTTYSCAAQTGAISYNWTVPAGATIINGQGTTSIDVVWTAPGGQVCVDWTDNCNTSPQTCTNVTVNPLPSMTAPANATYCAGDAVPASAFTSNPAGATFNWTNSNPAIGLAANGAGNTPGFTATNATGAPITATITVTPTLNGCVGNPVNYTITVDPTPSMTAPANATYCEGDAVPASAFASNPAGATFNWTNSNLAIGLAANGAGNTPGFTATNATGAPITATITVTPTLNGCVGNPVNYTITVDPTPSMTAPANATYCEGDAVPASAFTSNPAGATFNWTNSNPAIGLAANGAGNTPGFVATNGTGAPITGTITVTPTLNGCVGSPVNYTITVNPIPSAPTVASVTICPNNSTTLTATAPGGNYEWYDAAVGGTLLGTNASYTTPVLVATTNYWVETTLNGCTSPRTMVTVTVSPGLTVNAGPDDTICSGNSYILSGTPNGPGYTYLWDELPGNPGFSTLFNPTVSPTTTTTYVVTITDPSFCFGDDTVTIFVNPTPTMTAPANVTYCDGDAAPATAFTSNPAGATFNWTNSDPTIGLAANGTGGLPAFTATNSTGVPITATVTITPTLNGCPGAPVNYTITVNPTPTVTVPINATYCNGDVVPVTAFTSNPAGGTFAWTNSDPTIGLAANGAGGLPTFTATNAGAAPLTATIIVTPTVNGCSGTPSNFTITVNPTPSMTTPGNITICNGDPIAASAFTSTPAGGTFTWTNSDPSIGLATNGTGNTPAFTAVNAGTTAVTATITITPSVNGCVGLPVNYTITVNPGAIANVPNSFTVCNGDLVNGSTFTSTPAGGTFAWTNSNPGVGLAGNGTGNTPAFTATNNTGSPIFGLITVIATANGCPGPPSTYTITVNTAVTGSANLEICQGDSILIGGTYYNSAGSYLDTLATSVGCDSIVTYNLTVNPVTIDTTDIALCLGDSTYLDGNWYSSAGPVPVVYNSVAGCDSIVVFDISIDSVPLITIYASDTAINLGQTTTITAFTGQPNSLYEWSPPLYLDCIFCQYPVASPIESMWYFVTVTNQNGCTRMDSIYIEVDPTTNIYIPNIFSPNGDGQNDMYYVRGKGVEDFELQVFNRWGQMVFESDDIETGWDGTKNGDPMNPGVFVFKLFVRMYNGEVYNETGNITLIR